MSPLQSLWAALGGGRPQPRHPGASRPSTAQTSSATQAAASQTSASSGTSSGAATSTTASGNRSSSQPGHSARSVRIGFPQRVPGVRDPLCKFFASHIFQFKEKGSFTLCWRDPGYWNKGIS